MVSKLLLGASLSLFVIAPVLAVWQQGALWQHSSYGAPNSVALSSDGQYMAVGVQTGPASGNIQLYNKTGEQLWARSVPRAISSVAISANGSHVAAGGYQLLGPFGVYENGVVYYYNRQGTQLWNYTTGQSQTKPLAPPVFSVQLSNDGTALTASTDSSALRFDDQGRLVWSFNSTSSGLSLTSTSSDASLTAFVTRGPDPQDTLYLFNSQGTSLWNSSKVTDTVESMTMSGDGKYLAVGSGPSGDNGTLYLYNTTGGIIWTRHVNSPPLSIGFSTNDRVIVIGTNWGIISYNINGTVLWTYNQAITSSISVSPDGNYVLAGLWADWQQSILILNNQGQVVWGKDAGTIHQAKISADGRYAAIAAGPSDTGTFSSNSATVYYLNGPGTTTTNTGTAYSILYFIPTLSLVPPASALPAIPVASIVIADRRKSKHKTPNSQPHPPWDRKRSHEQKPRNRTIRKYSHVRAPETQKNEQLIRGQAKREFLLLPFISLQTLPPFLVLMRIC